MDYRIINGVYAGPKHFKGNLSLKGSALSSLGCLEVLEGSLSLPNPSLENLGNLIRVDGNLDLEGTLIKDLGNLRKVGGMLDLRFTAVKDFGNLKSAASTVVLPDGQWIHHFDTYKEEANRFLRIIRTEDYPVHMNHENWIVRSKVNKFLETGEI
jgi:hypothetical protein